MVEDHRYCVNCLARSHTLRNCQSLDTCRKCDRFHHTLLHPNQHQQRSSISTNQQQKKLQRQRKQQQRRKSKPEAEKSTPNAKILSEAIRSLAQVLCCSDQGPNKA